MTQDILILAHKNIGQLIHLVGFSFMAYQFHWKEVFDLVGIRYQ